MSVLMSGHSPELFWDGRSGETFVVGPVVPATGTSDQHCLLNADDPGERVLDDCATIREGEASYGQDGHYQSLAREHYFTDNRDGTVTDPTGEHVSEIPLEELEPELGSTSVSKRIHHHHLHTQVRRDGQDQRSKATAPVQLDAVEAL